MVWQQLVLSEQRFTEACWTTRGHSHNVFNLTLHPLDGLVASGADDGLVKVWSTEGALLHTLRGHRSEVTELQYSEGDGQYLAASFHDALDGATLFEHPSYAVVGHWMFQEPVRAICFLRIGGRQHALALADEATLRVYVPRAGGGKWGICFERRFDMEPDVSICLLKAGKGLRSGLLVVALSNGFTILDFSHGAQPAVLYDGAGQSDSPVTNVDLDLNGRVAACGSLHTSPAQIVWLDEPGAGYVHNVGEAGGRSAATRTGSAIERLKQHVVTGLARSADYYVSTLSWSCSGSLLFICMSSRRKGSYVHVVDGLSFAVLRTLGDYASACYVLEPHPRLSDCFFTADYGGHIRVVHGGGVATKVHKPAQCKASVAGTLFAAVWSVDGCSLVCGGSMGYISCFGAGASTGGHMVPRYQWFATDYDAVVFSSGRFIDSRTNLTLSVCLPGPLVDYEGRTVQGTLVEGHTTPAAFFRSLNLDQLDARELIGVELPLEGLRDEDGPNSADNEDEEASFSANDVDDDDDDDDDDLVADADFGSDDEEHMTRKKKVVRRSRSSQQPLSEDDEEANDSDAMQGSDEVAPPSRPKRRLTRNASAAGLAGEAELEEEEEEDVVSTKTKRSTRLARHASQSTLLADGVSDDSIGGRSLGRLNSTFDSITQLESTQIRWNSSTHSKVFVSLSLSLSLSLLRISSSSLAITSINSSHSL
jgi:WD40 repeat protein